MRGIANIALLGRLLLAAALAYLIVGVIWETAFELALSKSPTSDLPEPWSSPAAFVVWFVIPSALWPWSMSEFIPSGSFVAVVLFGAMTALMFGALSRLAPGVAAPPKGPLRPPRQRSAPRARAGRPRTS